MAQEVKNKVCIIGSRGMLGHVLTRESAKFFDVIALSRYDLDITDKEKTVSVLNSIKPRIVVLAAAYTDVDGCERNPKLASEINDIGVKNIACAVREIDAMLVSISSDYVFDGKAKAPYKEGDEPNPISVYGKSKLAGEKAVQSVLQKYVIVRSSWLFGDGDKGFVSFVLKSIKEKREIKAVHDKWASPTYTLDLSLAICKIIELMLKEKYNFEKNNIIHIVNSEVGSWHEVARYIFELLQTDTSILHKTDLANFPFNAKRPSYSALDSSRYTDITKETIRSWKDACKEFVECQKS